MLGSLMMLASVLSVSLPSSPRKSGTRCDIHSSKKRKKEKINRMLLAHPGTSQRPNIYPPPLPPLFFSSSSSPPPFFFFLLSSFFLLWHTCFSVSRSGNCERMRAAREMLGASTPMPYGVVKRRMTGSSAYVASCGASSQIVYWI